MFLAPFILGGPHLTGRSTGNAAPPSFRWLRLTGMSTGYASPPSCRWATPRRDVDGLCFAASISMGYTSPGSRRAMPCHLHFDGLHLAGMSTGYTSPPPFRWATPDRDVDGLCLAAFISMGFIVHLTGPSTDYAPSTTFMSPLTLRLLGRILRWCRVSMLAVSCAGPPPEQKLLVQ